MEFSMSRPCERRDPSVSAIALIAAARTLVSALEQRPFFAFEARGDGSLRSQGRPAERAEGGHMRGEASALLRCICMPNIAPCWLTWRQRARKLRPCTRLPAPENQPHSPP